MSVNMMQRISVAAFVLAGIFAVAALILWVTLDVRGIMDGLNGKAAERQIRELRKQNVRPQIAPSWSEHKNMPAYQKEGETVQLQGEELFFPRMGEGTAVLTIEEITARNGYRLVLNEVIVHTKEEIRII